MAGSAWTNQVVSLLIIQSAGNFQGLFVYSPTPGAGNLIGSWASTAGTDPYGNAYPQGLYATSVTFNLSGGRLLVYANETLTTTLTSGTSFTFPSALVGGVVNCRAVGAGGGGGFGPGTGGGGAEDAQETALAVTAGHTYAYSIGTGGTGSTGSGAGNGTNTTFAGDSVTVTAHGGGAGHDFPSVVVGAAGTGSTNSIHHDGGAGGSNTHGSLPLNGGGGGSSGGTSAAGTAGTAGDTASGGVGGTAPAGGGNGGNGGNSGAYNGFAGSVPGGGGGAGGSAPPAGNGAAGANGEIVLVYQVSNDLIASIAPTASSDSGGNAYPTGFGGQLNAFQPATYPSVVEAWHLATPLSNSWAASGAGVNGMFYRLLGSPPNTVQIIADITGGGGGTVCFTMPLGYIPGVAQNHVGIVYGTPAAANVSIATNGQVTIGSAGPVAFNIFVPLDGSL